MVTTEEFYSPTEPRDKQGKWTTGLRTGKGFGGLSAPRDNRVQPTARFSIPPSGKELTALGFTEGSLKERRVALFKSMYEHDLPDGHRSVVTKVNMDWPTVDIEGAILTKSGSKRGSFERKLTEGGDWYDASASDPSPYGPEHQNLKSGSGLSIDHTSFAVDDHRHAAGLGSAFIAASVAKYRELGIDNVTVYAGDSVGGYAWAREGFRIEDGMRNKNPYSNAPQFGKRHDAVARLIESASQRIDEKQAQGVIPKYDAAEAKKQLNALYKASNAGEDVQPIHIASIGENTMRIKGVSTETGQNYDSWPGKEAMLGTSWQGTYYFDASKSVTAAARWIEMFACHDATCAPPPAGTGGSTPGIQARRGVVPGYGPTKRRDITLGSVRVTYKPDYPDDHPDPGEVVWAKVRFQENAALSKDRPVLIIGRINGSNKLAAVQLTSNDRQGKDRLSIGSGSWDRLGRNTSVKLDQIIVIEPTDYRREGSTFGRDKFEAVVGRLAAYHRTPVTIAASAHLNALEDLEEEHWHREGMIEFACYDSSCRPPTSGGTGGSIAKGGPRGTKEAHLSRTPGRAAPNTTEFGKRINSMLDGDNNLVDMSKATIDAHHAKRAAQSAQDSEDRLVQLYAEGRPTVQITQRYFSQAEREGPVFNDAIAHMVEMRTAVLNLHQVRKDDYVPQNEAERILQEAIDKRIGGGLDPTLPLYVATSFGGIHLDGVRAMKFQKHVIVDDVMERSVTAVGHEIRKEIQTRLNTIDVDGIENYHRDIMAKANAIAVEAYGGELYAQGVSVHVANFSSTGLWISVHPPSGGKGLEADHPALVKIKALIEGSGIKSNNQANHVAMVVNQQHQQIIHEVLSEVTQLGGRLSGTPKNAKNKWGTVSSHDQVVAAVARYPESWINQSNEGTPLKFRQTTGRAHYKHTRNDGFSEITLDGSIATATHEFAHRFERTVPGVLDLEARFHDRRTVGEVEKRLGKGYGAGEVGKEDQFFNKYAGKTYRGTAFELLSMGYEHLHFKKDWDTIDDDYKAFVLGTLVSAYRG